MQTPLLDGLRAHVTRQPQSFHTPGHKSGRLLPPALAPWARLFAYDLTEVEGLDDLSHPQGILKASHEMAAQVYGAEAVRYSVGGSSLGLHALILGLASGREVFVPANAHRSILHGLILAHAKPIFLAPAYDRQTGRPLDLDPGSLEKACRQHPDCRHLIFVSPTYHGDCTHTAEVLALAKARGLMVLVDAAHGAHFPFHPALPEDVLTLGCDACVLSAHKSLPVATQGALLAFQNPDIIAPVARALRLLQTSSPSYLLLASLEAGVAMMGQHGHDLIGQGLARLEGLYQEADRWSHLALAHRPGAYDPFKVYLLPRQGSPQDLTDFLRDRGYTMEMTDRAGVLGMVGIDGLGVEGLSQALSAYDQADLPSFHADPLPPHPFPEGGPEGMTQAFFGAQRLVPLAAATGQRAAEVLTLDPPGTALVLPGQTIEAGHIQALLSRGADPQGLISVCLESSPEHDRLKG